MSYEFHEDEEWVDDDNDSDDMLACPACGAAVYEETQQCPHCREWIIPVDRSDRAKRVVWTIAAILIITSMLLFVVL